MEKAPDGKSVKNKAFHSASISIFSPVKILGGVFYAAPAESGANDSHAEDYGVSVL